MTGYRGTWQVWACAVVVLIAGACAGSSANDDETAAQGGSGTGEGGDRPYMPPDPPSCGGSRVDGNCYDWDDVVCSWQRVTVAPEHDEDPPLPDPCGTAEPLFDPPGNVGGYGCAEPGEDACATYVPIPSKVDEFSCSTVTYEHRKGECTIAGHCCALIGVRYCGP